MSPTSHTPSFATVRTATPLHLDINALSVTFGARRVLTDISFTVASGERAGLIGENGSGKSTLLKAAAGLIEPDRGFAGPVGAEADPLGLPVIGLLHQEPPFAPGATVGEALELAITPSRSAVAEVDRAAEGLAAATDHRLSADPARAGGADLETLAADRYARALAAAERLDAWNVDTRVASMLAGLGLAGLDQCRPTGTLSGGQLARLSLAWLLLSAPEVLLLDEPTNHLDDDAIEHLRRVIMSWRGPVLFASHDRTFLDETATTLLDLDPAPRTEESMPAGDEPASGCGVTRFTGSYTQYLAARAQTRARWERQFRDEQAELARLRAGIGDSQQVGHVEWKPRTETRMAQKFYADRNARVVARRVNDARARHADLFARQVRRPSEPLRFVGLAASGPVARPLADPDHADSPPIIEAEAAAVAGRLAPLDLRVAAGEKLLITGPNGVGKSTLLAILRGTLAPTAGSIEISPGTTVGLLAQQIQIPDPGRRGPGRTAAEAYFDSVGVDRAEAVPLATFGLLRAEDIDQPVAALSLGQQRRLALAILLATPPDLLLLDEPTNHLSLTLVSELERALASYPGTVVVASHDRWLRERWHGSRLALTETRGGSR